MPIQKCTTRVWAEVKLTLIEIVLKLDYFYQKNQIVQERKYKFLGVNLEHPVVNDSTANCEKLQTGESTNLCTLYDGGRNVLIFKKMCLRSCFLT